MNKNEDPFEDDELMRKVSRPPEFPPATREQVEQTWQGISAHIEAQKTASPGALPRAAQGGGRSLPAWLESLFPAAPVWSWQLAKVAALIVIGFTAAWVAAGQGWLPGTVSTDVASVTPPAATADPDRTWMATNDYGNRLEALLLGVATSDATADGDVAPAAREVSRELLNDNRFYQRVAQRNDDPALAELLSRIEVILLALATAPEGQEQQVISTLREFIDESGVLGELRDVQSSVPRMPRSRAAAIGS